MLEAINLTKVYEAKIKQALDKHSVKFCREALDCWDAVCLPDGYNMGLNEGRAAGRTVDHLHWHIISRYKGDVADPIGGVRHVIPDKGNYRK